MAIPDLFLLGWGYTGDPGVFMNPMFMLDPARSGTTMSIGPEYGNILSRAAETNDNTVRWQSYAAANACCWKNHP